MKQWKKMLVSAGAALTLLLQGTLVGSAAPATKEWLDPFNDASFPLAKAVNMKYPAGYDAKPAKDKVFSLNSDKKALAVIKTGATQELFERVLGKKFSEVRKSTLMKDYVGVELEIIYEFKNGFKEFEFMGACGEPGIWAGMFGKENTIEFSYADTQNGPYHAYDYKAIRDITSADSTRAYFRSSAVGDVPTSARYLKIRFLHGFDESGKPEDNKANYPSYANWMCALGYLYVKEYTAAPTPDKTTAAVPGNNKTTAAPAPGHDKTTAPAPGHDKTTSVAPGENKTTAAAPGNETTAPGGQTTGTASGETQGQTADTTAAAQDGSSGVQQTITVTRVNWPVVIALIVGGVVLAGGAVAFVLIRKRKKG